MSNKKVTIDLDEYINLKGRDLKLDFLECGGVDNWGGYGESLYPEFDDEEELDYDDALAEMKKEINEKYK